MYLGCSIGILVFTSKKGHDEIDKENKNTVCNEKKNALTTKSYTRQINKETFALDVRAFVV